MFVRTASLVCVLALAAVLAPSQVDASTTVRITMVAGGSFDIELNDNTPLARDNFLNYVSAGRYTNTVFHRSDHSINVLQGGGFALPAAGSNNFLDTVATYAPVTYEANLGWSNTLGTIGAARLGDTVNGVPAADSATSQWFVNLADNSSIFDDAVRPGDGYTVFGRIISGLDVAQALFAEKVWDWTLVLNNPNLPMSRLPLGPSYDGGHYPVDEDFLTIKSALVLSTTSLAAPVPEPATLALLAVGGLALLRRRGRK